LTKPEDTDWKAEAEHLKSGTVYGDRSLCYETLRDVTKCNLVTQKDISRHENPLNSICYEISQKVRGEENNILTALCALISRDLPEEYRFSIIVINKSSTGKSYFWKHILPMFEHDVIERTAMTDASYKSAHKDVNHKIIHQEQLETKNEDGELAMRLLKHSMSEGKITIELKGVHNKGKKVPIIETVLGTPVVVTTATSNDIDSETLNRFVVLELSEDSKQTGKVLNHISIRYSDRSYRKDEAQTLINNTNWVKEQSQASRQIEDILIPFAELIDPLLSKNVEMRRDYEKILKITCAITASNFRYRDKFKRIKADTTLTSQFGDSEPTHKAILIATLEDLQYAIKIAGHAMNRTVNKASKKTEEIYDKMIELCKASLDNSVTLREVTESFEGQFPETTIRDHIKTLAKLGYLTTDYTDKVYRYTSLGKKFTHLSVDSIKYTAEMYLEWIKNTLDTSLYSWENSYDSPIDANLCLKTGKDVTKTGFVGSRNTVDNLVGEDEK